MGWGAVWTREEAKAGWESSPLSDLCGDHPPGSWAPEENGPTHSGGLE